MSVPPATTTPLTRKDFESDQDVRWCPGCGDYAILAQVQKRAARARHRRARTLVFVSGIGCSSRFPYYVNTYGFHTIHGRAPAIATGLEGDAPGALGVGGDRRRRRALDRRQPSHPRAAPQRRRQHPAVQQPHLRPHQGPVLADLRARQGHQVDAGRLGRSPVQSDRRRARRRGDVRRAHRSTSRPSTSRR